MVEIDKSIVGPEPVSEFIPGNNLSVTLKEQDKNLQRLLLELDAQALLSELTRLQVYLENAEADMSRRVGSQIHTFRKLAGV